MENSNNQKPEAIFKNLETQIQGKCNSLHKLNEVCMLKLPGKEARFVEKSFRPYSRVFTFPGKQGGRITYNVPNQLNVGKLLEYYLKVFPASDSNILLDKVKATCNEVNALIAEANRLEFRILGAHFGLDEDDLNDELDGQLLPKPKPKGGGSSNYGLDISLFQKHKKKSEDEKKDKGKTL